MTTEQGFFPRGHLAEGVDLDAHQRAILATVSVFRFLGEVHLIQGTPAQIDALEGLTWARDDRFGAWDEDRPAEKIVARLTDGGWQARRRIRGLAQD